MRRGPAIAAIVLWGLAVGAAAARGASLDERFVEGLRERRLYELAEKFCAQRLADSRLGDEARIALTIELSRTWADRALDVPASAQPPLWQKARGVVDEFAKDHPSHPRLLVIRVQSALTALAEAQRAREEAELAGGQGAPLAAAQGLVRTSVAQLRKLDTEAASGLKRPPGGRDPAAEGPSVAELMSLQTHLRYELARALRNQALCYPPLSADRINSLSQAVELLSALAQQELEPPLAWFVRGDEITCRRLLGDFATAERQLAALEKMEPSGGAAAHLRAERIRLALARRHLDDALSEAGAPSAPEHVGGSAVELARLEAYLAAWQRGLERHDARGAADWEKAAVNQVGAIERGGDPFSTRQAESLLARSMTRQTAPQSVAALVRAAQGFYRGGQLDEAVATYDQAARRARDAHDAAAAFEVGFSAATIQRERENYRDAIDRYRKLAMLAPREPRAAEAHLLAVHCAAQLAQQQPQPKLDEYERLLREHVATWPKGATASQAWWWLGRLEEHEQVYPEAIRALRNVPADDAQYAAAVEAIGRCYAIWLPQLRHSGKPSAQHAADAVRYFEQVIGPAGQKSNAMNDAQRTAVLVAARLWLLEIPNGAAHAEELLNRALGEAADAPAPWKAAARSLLVLAVSAEGRTAAAEELLAQTPIGSPTEALAMVSTLAELTRRASGQRKRRLAELQLRAIDDLLAKRDELDPDVLAGASRQRATALAEAGRRGDAIAALEALAADSPRDGQTHEDLATLWMNGGDAAELRKALAKWGDITLKSRPGSPRWFRAHFGLARVQFELGNVAQARATIKLVESAHPDFGGADLKFKFQELLGQCDRQAASSDAKKK